MFPLFGEKKNEETIVTWINQSDTNERTKVYRKKKTANSMKKCQIKIA